MISNLWKLCLFFNFCDHTQGVTEPLTHLSFIINVLFSNKRTPIFHHTGCCLFIYFFYPNGVHLFEGSVLKGELTIKMYKYYQKSHKPKKKKLMSPIPAFALANIKHGCL